MYRWIIVLSFNPIFISDVILSPGNFLIQTLSKDASYHPEFTGMNNHVTNGDGFGVGWYHTNSCQSQPQPHVMKTSTRNHGNGNETEEDTTSSSLSSLERSGI
jgi:predicted glutamine amidotransferase